VEPRGLAAHDSFGNTGGRGAMRKTPITLQDLRRRIYVKAKAEPSWRFWGLYVHICKRETLRTAYRLARKNDGAPGIDGVSFEAVETQGVESFLEQIRTEMVQRTYRPQRVRNVDIPKSGGKVRTLSIPTIRDRVVQGALKLILEPVFEADFQPGSYGYRPKKSAHDAVQRVADAIIQGKTHVIDLDLRAYFDNVRHHTVLQKVAKRVNDDDVMHLLKMVLIEKNPPWVIDRELVSWVKRIADQLVWKGSAVFGDHESVKSAIGVHGHNHVMKSGWIDFPASCGDLVVAKIATKDWQRPETWNGCK